MNVNLEELNLIPKILEELKELKEKRRELPEWLNERQCWELKGGCAYNTYHGNRYYQPLGGIAEAKIGGRKCWSKATVEEWLKVTDEMLDEYHAAHKTGATKR